MQKLKLFFLTLSILFFFIKGNGQWSVNPSENNPVCTLGGNQTSSQIISDGASGAIIIWEDYRNGNYDIYASRIDANGYKLWGTDGVAICTEPYGQQLPGIISDGVGGAIIAWRDYRDFYPAEGTSIDVYAQRVNASGVVQWTVGGVPICKAQYRQQDVAIVGDGMGGAIIAWNDSRVDNMKSRIYAQRISADGIVQWATDGIAVSLLADVRNHPRIATDGAGGAIIVWQDERDELSTKSDIYVQRINSSGTVVWNAGGVAICTLANYQLLPELVSDGVGGAIMTWFDYRGGNADIYAQRVNGSGVPQWTSNGVPICTKAKNQYSPMIVSDASGGAIITWNDNRAGTQLDVYAQRINPTGTVLWTENGAAVATSTVFQNMSQLTADGSGGAVIGWHNGDNLKKSSDIYAQRINSSGVVQWVTNGTPVSIAPGFQIFPKLINDGTGGVIFTWEDYRNLSSPDIYAQWVSPDGNLGNSSSIRGKKFLDTDGDCVQDFGETALQNWVIKLEPGPSYAFTDEDGKYSFQSLKPGVYTLSETMKPYWQQTCPTSPDVYIVNLGNSQNVVGKDFGNQVAQSVQDLTLSVGTYFPSPLQSPCCGQEMTYLVQYSNLGTMAVTDATLEVNLSSHAQYQTTTWSDPQVNSPVSAPGNKIIYTLPTPLLPGASGVLHITVLLTCSVESSPMIVTQFRVEPLATDANKQDNTFNSHEQVSCSYDPNDKSVMPQGCGAEGLITMDDSLTYHIRFQNLGSGPAYRVIVRDTLDSDLDLSTVTTLGSSHPNIFTMNGNELVWTFWGIVLPPETTDEAGSHGFVRFKVKQLASNPAGTVIQNRAGIYFDLNPVVMTNQTTNTITTDPMPVANFTIASNCVGNICTYDFTYTGGTAGATFEWDFGADAIPPTSTEQNPTGISYSTFSEKVVSLRVFLGACSSVPSIMTLMNPSTPPQFDVRSRWNLVSLPYEVADYTKSVVFPTATSGAFAFDNGYNEQSVLQNGIGYWLKFSYAQNMYVEGTQILEDTIVLNEGWSLIGSVAQPVAVSNLTSIPPGLVTSQFFGYKRGYIENDTLKPGRGYWVKVEQEGTLILSSVIKSQSSVNRITIIQTTELPPLPPDDDVVHHETRNPNPETFTLEQAYPNPFNPLTVIRYQLPVRSFVTLKVIDLLGREIATLAEDMEDAGVFRKEWNASNVPSGMYFYRISAQGTDGTVWSDVKKMVLIK